MRLGLLALFHLVSIGDLGEPYRYHHLKNFTRKRHFTWRESDCEELVGVTQRLWWGWFCILTCNQPVEIAFIFEFLISNKLYTATLIITIIPP